MRGELVRRLQNRQWIGPQAAVNGDDLFVLSDAVPRGEAWKLVQASIFGNTNGNVAIWLYAVPPWVFGYPLADFFSKIGTFKFYLPTRGAVQLSVGGTPASNEIQEVSGIANSVRVFPRSWRSFFLPPGWGLLGTMSSPTASTGFLTLSVGLIRVGLDECLC